MLTKIFTSTNSQILYPGYDFGIVEYNTNCISMSDDYKDLMQSPTLPSINEILK